MKMIYRLHTSTGGRLASFADLAAARERGAELARAWDVDIHIVAAPIIETIISPLSEDERLERANAEAERVSAHAERAALADAYLETLPEDRRGFSVRFQEASDSYRDAHVAKMIAKQKAAGAYY